MAITTTFDPPVPGDNKATFNSKSFALFASLNSWSSQANALGAAVNSWALAAAASQAAALASETNAGAAQASAQASAALAAGYAGAAPFVGTATYGSGVPALSLVTGLIYRRRSSGQSLTDPSGDPANWAACSPNGMQMVSISAASGTLTANADNCCTNAAAVAMALPTLAVGDAIVMRCDNGRTDNTLDLGSKSWLGINGQIRSGVITLNVRGPVRLRWWGDYLRDL